VFEVCGHKWMDISQADKGVTVITDSKYGWHVRDNHVSLSLLKSPKNPDANCDMHKHFIYYAILPHTGTLQQADVIQRAYELNTLGANNVPIVKAVDGFTAAFATTSNKAVVVEAVKVSKPQVASVNTLLIRLYEAHGGNADNTEIILSGFTPKEVFQSNGLEIKGDPVPLVGGNRFVASFKPFQIQSFLVTF